MNADLAALLITALILIAMMVWVPFLEWCAGCMRYRDEGERSAHPDERELSLSAHEGEKAIAEGR